MDSSLSTCIVSLSRQGERRYIKGVLSHMKTHAHLCLASTGLLARSSKNIVCSRWLDVREGEGYVHTPVRGDQS